MSEVWYKDRVGTKSDDFVRLTNMIVMRVTKSDREVTR